MKRTDNVKKNEKNRHKSLLPKNNITDLKNSRDGGQIALRGYSYQFLYSCYLILSSGKNAQFQLEGIEDIDCIKQEDGNSSVTHIQLKYSVNKQDASFLSDVLKNFLETYLLDQNRFFKLVYDFPVAKGHLRKLFESNLDDNSRAYWADVISKIRQKNPYWNWAAYDFNNFISRLSFEKIEKATLAAEIEKALIAVYGITTDNISLFTNSIQILCFEKMEQRAYVTKDELDIRIQSVKIDISKGVQNPAHSWIRKLDFSKPSIDEGRSFYEGKKATPADIVSGLPIERLTLKNDVINSVKENTVTVIKASSGQGKTTLALQVAYFLQKEYKPYQLLWCNDIKESGNIVQFFKARIRLGEKLLILIDNLDNHLSKWNYLAQLMQSELHRNYKLLITSREIDWYNYRGDLSNVQSINIIRPVLEERDAIEIFNLFKAAKHLHPSVTSWQKAWNQIAERQLLIEYVYLLTHGEMLSERISSQISEIGKSPYGNTKCEILRKVCFADLCGIKLSVVNLYANLSETPDADFGELIKSMESEFLVHLNTEAGYIEGLHPIRSKHIVERLHEFFPIDNTALSVIEISNKPDLPVLFSHLPEFDLNKDEFVTNVIEKLWDENDLSNYISAMQGIFCGSVRQYFLSNQSAFDDANAHGGLFFISADLCPFAEFKEFGITLDALDKIKEIFPDNKNVEYLCGLRSRIPNYNLKETFIYSFCSCLYRKISRFNLCEINDVASYAHIAEWIYNVDSAFNLSVNIPLEHIWLESERLPLDCISTLMYVSYCGNKDVYIPFVKKELNHIVTYLKQQTKSQKIWIDLEKNAIHIEYILRLRDIRTGSEQSVSRLKYICKTLPIFDLYCADALKPTLNLLSAYTVPDDAHKEMPIRNIVIMFHQNLTSLWNKTIMSNYEFDTVTEWFDHWLNVREHICLLANKCCACIYKLLGGKPLGGLGREVDQLHEELNEITTGEKLYPKEDRPLEKKASIPQGLVEVKNKYFQSVQNFMNQFAEFLLRDNQNQSLAMFNLTTAQSALTTMQNYFGEIAIDLGFEQKHLDLCNAEVQNIEQLIMCCSYYKTHFPNKYFNKYEPQKWYEAHCREERKAAESVFSHLQSKYVIAFPEQIYTIGILRYYPIIINDFNLTSASHLSELFPACISFADCSFDYLVILSANKDKRINPVALQFPKKMFISIKKAINSEDYSSIDKLITPYQVDVTLQMLGCFKEKYDFIPRSVPDAKFLPIEDLAEELWIYSKYEELLTDKEDTAYLVAETQNIQASVTNILCTLRGKLTPEDFDQINRICNEVFSGKRFDDVFFNDVIEHFVQKQMEK